MNSLKPRKINKEDFLSLNEDNLMFITNPGRMGDEDGSTFVIKNEDELTVYRVDGWMYSNSEVKVDDRISMEDAAKQFPKWYDTWKHSNDKNYKGKYNYIYMGFGNGLCVDNSIYSEFEPYLNNSLEKYLEGKNEEERESLLYAAIFNVWKQAVVEMAKDKKILIKCCERRKKS